MSSYHEVLNQALSLPPDEQSLCCRCGVEKTDHLYRIPSLLKQYVKEL
jgi:hypothetical protein